MKLKDAAKYLPFVQAAAEGKTIQTVFGMGTRHEQWEDILAGEDFDPQNFECYRIKPSPKLRPFKPEEVPMGAVILFPNGNKAVVTGLWDNLVKLGVIGKSLKLEDVTDCKYSIDGEKTWKDFGVLETE